MSKAIKTIAPIALAATGFGMAGYGPMAGMFAQTASIHTGIAGIAAGGFGGISTALQIGGFGMNVAGQVQQRKFASQQSGLMAQAASTQNKANEVAQRYRSLQAKQLRLKAQRVSRINQGDTIAAGANAGLGSGGNSTIYGSAVSQQTQLSAQLGASNVGEGYSDQISGLNRSAANSMSQANQAKVKGDMWTQMDSLGTSLQTNSDKISSGFTNLFGK